MRRSFFSLVPLAACVLAACSADDLPKPDDSPIGETASRIINGQLDGAHEAVVALVLQQGNQQGLCSGTIVKTDPNTRVGWVLTAAHCTELPVVMALQGDDFNANPTQYAVLDYQADSRYTLGGAADQPYDVAVVRILGVDANTPTIGIASASDGVANNASFTALGYGRTAGGTGAAGDADGKRRRISLRVDGYNTAQFSYSMASGGTCQGDSGGPDLISFSGVEKVVGVHSYVQGECDGEGVSGRVSGNLTFINAQLSKAVPTLTCDQCRSASLSGKQKCAQMSADCLADQDCSALETCLSQAGSTSAAQQACLTKYPNEVGKILAAQSCACADDCASTCANDANCKGMPKCGFSLPAGSCATCGESSCCQEMSDCLADGTCFNCLQTNDADASCASNAARKTIATCFQSHCSSECSDSGIDKGAPDGGTKSTGDGTSDGSGKNGSGTSTGDGTGDEGDDTSAPATVTTTKSGCSLSSSPRSGSGAASMLAMSAIAAAVTIRRRRRTAA
jgi:hypothetical protein